MSTASSGRSTRFCVLRGFLSSLSESERNAQARDIGKRAEFLLHTYFSGQAPRALLAFSGIMSHGPVDVFVANISLPSATRKLITTRLKVVASPVPPQAKSSEGESEASSDDEEGACGGDEPAIVWEDIGADAEVSHAVLFGICLFRHLREPARLAL